MAENNLYEEHENRACSMRRNLGIIKSVCVYI